MAVSKSYWCFDGSAGFGSMRIVPLKPILCLYSTTMLRNRPAWSSSDFMSVLRKAS